MTSEQEQQAHQADILDADADAQLATLKYKTLSVNGALVQRVLIDAKRAGAAALRSAQTPASAPVSPAPLKCTACHDGQKLAPGWKCDVCGYFQHVPSSSPAPTRSARERIIKEGALGYSWSGATCTTEHFANGYIGAAREALLIAADALTNALKRSSICSCSCSTTELEHYAQKIAKGVLRKALRALHEPGKAP